MSEILDVEDMHVGFNGKEIIKGLSFTVRDGDVLAIIGPNGSGKTTVLKAVLGTIPVKAGRVKLFGKEKFKKTGQLISYIPQRIEVDRTFPISLREMLGLSLRGASIEKYIDLLELRGVLSKKVGDLSGGEMQRALLAYAIIKEPALLIMDEPTSWVDVKGADCMLCIMEEFKKKGIAMMVVSHDFSVVRSVATNVLGIGPENYFFEPADSPVLEKKLESLFGTMHHEIGLCPPFNINR
jgi:ABC-type Mn2+/Zn2+ transport system ATPase subunit